MRQTGRTSLVLLFTSLTQITVFAQVPVPAGTGAGGARVFHDPNFEIVAETLSSRETARSAPAWIAPKRAGRVPEFAGTHWIDSGGDPMHRLGDGRNSGPVTYQTQFMASPEIALHARVLAEGSFAVNLNGKLVYSSTAEKHIHSAMVKLTGFIAGLNTVSFAVSGEGGSSNGLDVAFSDAGAPPSGPHLAFKHPAYPDAMTFPPTAAGVTSAQTLYVINNGDATAAFAVIGPATGDFSVDPKTQDCGAPLEPGEYCTFNVVFAPAKARRESQTGTLKISLRGGVSRSVYTVNLTGTTGTGTVSAVTEASLAYTPASMVFTAPAGKISAEQIVKITNTGGSPAIFSDLYYPSNFVLDWNPPSVSVPACSKTLDLGPNLAAGASCALGITFKPTTAAVFMQSLDPTTPIPAGLPSGRLGIDLMCPTCRGELYALPLMGTVVSGPILTFTPNPMVFASPVPAGSAGVEQVKVTIRNTGDAAGTIANLPAHPIFKAAGDDCTKPPRALAPGAACDMPFTFNPSANSIPGVLAADPLTAAPGPVNIVVSPGEIPFALSAKGTVTAAVAGPAIAFSPASPMGLRSKVAVATSQTINITNPGSATLDIGPFRLDGSSAYAASDRGCIGSHIPANAATGCSVVVTFTPASVGSAAAASLVFYDSAASSPQTYTLNGVGLGPVVSIDNTTLKMVATIGTGGQSTVAAATLKNIGNDDLVISNNVSGDLTGFSRVLDTCSGLTIAPQGTCTYKFSFVPSQGPKQTTFTIKFDNATPSTQTITLLGSIAGAAINVSGPFVSHAKTFLDGSPCSGDCLTFSTVINKPSITQVTLTNAGSVDIAIQDLFTNTLADGFYVSDKTQCFAKVLRAGDPGQLGDSCTFFAGFNPTAATVKGVLGSLFVTTNITPPPSTLTISLFGLATAAPIAPPANLCQEAGPGLPCIQAPRAYRVASVPAVTDPVDGASGQFYDTLSDLNLGGPFNLQFVRYYASGLSAGGYKSSLGTNWMSNFDVGMALNNNTAEVLLFGGKFVNFSKAGGLWTLVSPTDTGYQFAEAGSGYQFMSPVSGFVYTFNSVGKLASMADGKGNVLTVTQGAGGPASISDGLGRSLALTYTGGNLTNVQDQAGRSVSYAYTGGNLSASIDALKKTTQYTYATAGKLAGLMTKKQLPAGNVPTTQTYDASGRVTVQTDGNGNATRIGYDGKGGTSITGAIGGVSQQANNAAGGLGQLTDPAGNSLNVTFDNAERRAGFTDKMGNAVKFTYHSPTGNIASRTDELGNTTSYTYTARTVGGFTFYDLTGIAFPDGTTNTMAYDANGNPTSRTAADGTTETRTYDNNGRLLAVMDAQKQSTTFAYDSGGNLASRQDALGNKEIYSYTAAGQPSRLTDADGGVRTFTYDANGRPLSLTDPAGAAISNRYDDNGQRVAVTNQAGGVFAFTYTPTLKIASISDPFGNKTVFSYDAEDRQTSAVNSAGETVSRAYDTAGHLLSLADKRGLLVKYTYDPEGRILSQTDPTGNVTNFGYDAAGQLTSSTMPDGSIYTFANDKSGRLLSLANPLGETQSVTRDAKGRVTQVGLPGGLTSAIQFDMLGRMSAITSPNGNTWALTNDALGRISSFTDPLGNSTTRSYTGTQLSGMTLPLGTLAFTRDKNGRVTQRQYSDGTTMNSAYDPMGRLTSSDGVAVKRDIMGHPVIINGIALTYTSAGRLATLTYAPGKTVTYSYDNAGHLSSVGDWVGGRTTFAYDPSNRLIGLTYPNGVANTFSFDVNSRISGIAAGNLSSIALTRDADGKITSADRNLPAAPALQSASQQYSYDAAARMNGEKFDAMGRALTQNGRTYTWNLASQLTGFQDSVNSATLTYDGLGQLSSSNVSGVTRTFVFNHATRYPALSIVRQGGSDLRYYVYTPEGKLLYSIEAADKTRKFYHFDEMGNTTMLTADDGSISDSYAITPYGDIADHVGPTENPFTWQGEYGIIQESQGLYFMRSRHYDASASRFLSPDPLTTPDPRSAEPYTYARGNPLYYIDPSGALSWEEISHFQIQTSGLDDHIPNAAEAVSLLIDFLNPNARTMFSLILNHPGWTWDQLHSLRDNSVANALASCNKLGLACDTNRRVALATLVANGGGGQIVQSASSLLALGSQLVAAGGGNIVSTDGSSVVSHDAGGFHQLGVPSLISQDGSGLISNKGGGLVSDSAGTLVSDSAGTLIGNAGGTLIGNAGGTLVSDSAGTLVSDSAGTLVSAGGGNVLPGR